MGCPTVYDGYMVRYIVDFGVRCNYFDTYGFGTFIVIFMTLMDIHALCLIFMLRTIQTIVFLKIMLVRFLSMNFILLGFCKVGFVKCLLNGEPYKRVDVRS